MSGLLSNIAEGQNAWVVFSGQTEISWLKFLRPGFRHCYVLINDGERWTSIDPLSHITEVSSTSAPTTTDNTQNEGAQELTPEKQREKNLLSRPRSRIGTILTSFRGILLPSETQAASARKTLLGE